MDFIAKIKKRLEKNGFDLIKVENVNGAARITGEVSDYSRKLLAGKLAVDKKHSRGVINDITVLGLCDKQIVSPAFCDNYLEGKSVDAVIIGGGIVGSAILRELSKYDIKALLLEKEYDVATAQSSRNDGMIHAGIDLKPTCNKIKYNMRGNKLYDTLSKELDVPIRKCGQYVLFTNPFQKLIYPFVVARAKKNDIPIKYMSSERIAKDIKNPGLSYGGMFFAGAGVVSPYLMTVAFCENAVSNGGEISLNTVVTDVINKDGVITAVKTNRGTVGTRVIINAAGVYSDVIAEMCGDRHFTIHPRRGTELILDKNAKDLTGAVVGRFALKSSGGKSHTKGGGIIRTIDNNVLLGPSADESPERENEETSLEKLNEVFDKMKKLTPEIKKSDIITYFAGTRAATYEEDFIVEKSPIVKNLIQAAGIQSPGITAAPAIAEDVAEFVKSILGDVQDNKGFNGNRTGIPRISELSLEERARLIKENPDYGVIICRCEEISKGEIKDALKRNPCPPTLDAIKRRVRAGMGRCQGGFCAPVITKIIAEERSIDVTQVLKKGTDGKLLFSHTKTGGDL